MKISIVTLNFNGSENTIKLLKSLGDQTDKDFQIIVVDNASEEADFSNLQTGINQLIHSFSLTTRQVVYPQVKVVSTNDNLGFSGGNNVGIRQILESGASWVVFLNNDTWVERGFIERLKAVLETRSGIIGIPLVEGDQTAYCGKIQWLKPTLEHVRNVGNDGGVGDDKTIPTSEAGYRTVPCEAVEQAKQGTGLYHAKRSNNSNNYYAIGGAMAVHKSVFDKIGLLDEKYFLYFEDADFSVRARKAGFDISVAKNLNVHHHVSSSTKKLGSPLLLRYHYRNALYFNSKNGPWYVKFLVWPWSLITVIRQLGKLVINRNRGQSKAILSGVFDFYKNKMGKIKK